MSDIKIGSSVRITGWGQCYSSHVDAARTYGLTLFKSGYGLMSHVGKIATVVGSGKVTEGWNKSNILAIQVEGQQYIIGQSGVELVQTDIFMDYRTDEVVDPMLLEDIMDFMRVKLIGSDATYVVFTNVRAPGAPKQLTDGKRARALVLSEVEAVYSQPQSSEILNPKAVGKLRYKRLDASKLATAQAAVAAAEAALEQAKADLAKV